MDGWMETYRFSSCGAALCPPPVSPERTLSHTLPTELIASG